MAGQIPVQTWGRLISPNEDELPAQLFGEMPATISITMAALDPGEDWAQNNGVDVFKGKKPRATIKMIVFPPDDDDDDGSSDEDDETDPELAALLDGDDSDEDSDEDDRGEGPSDPAKTRRAQLAQELLGHDEPQVNGVKKNKGKGKAVDLNGDLDGMDEDEDEEDSDDDDLNDIPSEYVLCTLDPDNVFQQPLNLTISENEKVFFRVEGTHSVHLTGNYLSDLDGPDGPDDEYDLPPDDDELVDYLEDSEEENSSDVYDEEEGDDPRVMELDDDEQDEAPKLVPAKGKNKRAAAADSDEVDDDDEESPAAAALPPSEADKPLSKSQLKKMRKKLKDNEGNAVAPAAKEPAANGDAKASPGKADKKVQFAKTLVQGPSGTEAAKKDEQAGKKKAATATLGVKTVDGVTVDDKKLGAGPAAKKGDKVSMRYIGKLDKDKRVFDSNKKGAPFTFKLGSGQVIKGWDIGVAGMSVGGERRITVPAHLAYGSKKTGDIPANATLVFDLKLLEIK